jgi:hypothetical protein
LEGTNVKIITETSRFKRKMRSPQHPFNLRVQPWQIQPCFIAPVLPGETMKRLNIMSRVVSDPLKDKLMGWWCEYFFFYVKHRDLAIRDALVSMHLDQGFDISGQYSGASAAYYHAGRNSINYTAACLAEVVKWYFRDADEANPTAIGGMDISKINIDGWWQSMREGAAVYPAAADGELPGDTPTIPTQGVPSGYATQYAQWQQMVSAGITSASFEDYLRSWGVKVEEEVNEEIYRPELIRYIREFTYPTNTVEPTTGVPSSAAVWSVTENATKDRYFKEPGFLFGVQLVRPKVMLSKLDTSLTHFLTKAFDWLPATLLDESYMSLKSFDATAAAAGPINQVMGDVQWVDLKDLFLYGDQFYNHSDQKAAVALPDTGANVKYASSTDADALFVDTSTPKKYVRSDGIVSVQIASAIGGDTTP